jgi:bzd-type benzoyl-CoA reductase N subunit
MDYEKLFNTDVTSSSMVEWKKQGKKTLGTICCHVPEEIIHAAGILPVRLRATGCKDNSTAETWMSSLACSYASSTLQYMMDGTYDLDGMIATDGCLMAGRIFDNWAHVNPDKDKHYLHQMAAPRIANELSLKYYVDEMNDIRKDLEEFSGVEITDEKIKESIDLYNETRALIRELYDLRKAEFPVINGTDSLKIVLAATSMPKEEFNTMLKSFLNEAKDREPIKDHRVRLMLIGSALDDPEYTKVIEDKGGLIVTDAVCFGSRYLWEPVEVDDENLLESLANSYLKRPVCPRMLDLHDELHEFILDMVKDFKVDGIVYQKMQNCECWGGELVYLDKLMKDAGIPMLVVEREELMANAGQLAIRTEAFIEMIVGSC